MDPKITISIRVDQHTLDRLDRIAERLNTTRSMAAACILTDAAPGFEKVATVASSSLGSALLMAGGVLTNDSDLMRAVRKIEEARNTRKTKEKPNVNRPRSRPA